MPQGRRYRVISILGQGGFGTVYRARLLGEGGFSKPVALKVLNPELSSSGELQGRLRDEARVLGLVQHRAIVKVDALVCLDGRWAVVMEFVEGRDLKTILGQGPIPVGPALEIAAEVAGALHAAWVAVGPEGTPLHLLHRDIKPANLCITSLGEVKVLDFGIARAEFSDREAHTQSQAFGTPDYMAPERFWFENGPEADIYAVGATLYEMLTGERLGRGHPHPGNHAERVNPRLDGLRLLLGPAHEDVVALLGEMINHDRALRPAARDVERRLTRLRHGKAGELLRDWAEKSVPPLLARLEMEAAGSPETILVEQTLGSQEDISDTPSRGSWPLTAASPAQPNTFALGATPRGPDARDGTLIPPDRTPDAPATEETRRATPRLRIIALGVIWGLLGGGGLALAALWVWNRSVPPDAEVQIPARTGPATDVVPTPTPEPAPAPESAPPAPVVTPVAPKPRPAPPTTAAPTTAPTAPKTAAPGGDGPAGRWEGSMNGRPLDLVLTGTSAALRGKSIVSLGGNSVDTQVTGSYNPETRTLTLEDAVTAPDAGRYSATLSEDGAHMVGSFQFRDRSDRVAFTASRSQ